MIIALLIGTLLWVTLTQIEIDKKSLLSTNMRQYILMGVIFFLVLPSLFGLQRFYVVKDVFQPFLSGIFLGELVGSLITWFRTRKYGGVFGLFSSKSSTNKSSNKSSHRSDKKTRSKN
jgi:hypothetical protein